MDFGISLNAAGGCIAIGNFDGVHRGHRRMLAALITLAAEQQTHSVAVTFHPHPISLLRPEFAPPVLTTIEDRCELLQEAGIERVLVLPVTPALLAMSASDFFRDFVVGELKARGMVEGANFRFGLDRAGDVRDLTRYCEAAKIPLKIVDLVTDDASEISSSRIRQAIREGHIQSAVHMLGHGFRLRGMVHRGARRGSELGFPTANLEGIATLLPANGVYAGVTRLGGRRYVTAVSIGPNSTFGEGRIKVECHLDNFSGSLYGTELAVDLLAEVREQQQFSSVEALIRQIRNDVQKCREIVASVPVKADG